MYNYKIQSFYLIARFHNCDLDVLITDAFHLFPFINLERKAIARVQALVEAPLMCSKARTPQLI